MSSIMLGRTLLDQFRLDSFIAAGGMGTVYKVWDLKRNAWMAIKTLHSDLAEDQVMFKRFQREASVLQWLAHPNIVPFYGLYQAEALSFLVELFIDGPTLKDILRDLHGQPMPLLEAMVYLRPICSALGYAHNKGVVHCDVKPGNVMIDQGGMVYLADFGIVRHIDSTLTSITPMGTPAYMAPEQIRGEQVSPATDVYALGILAYELFTGHRPFTGMEKIQGDTGERNTAERLRSAHLKLPPPDPRSINPDLPPALSSVLLKALEKDRARRYNSVQEFWLNLCYAAGMSPESLPERVRLPGLASPVQAQRPVTPVARQGTPINTVERPAELPVHQRWFSLSEIIRRNSFFLILGLVVVVIAGVPLLIRPDNGKLAPVAPPPATQLAEMQITRTQAAPEAQVTNTRPAPVQPNVSMPVPQQPSATPPFSPTDTPAQPLAGQHDDGDTMIDGRDMATLIYIAKGSFWQGLDDHMIQSLLDQCSNCKLENYSDAQPLHQVYLSAFWIDKFEITNRQYQTCEASGECTPPLKAESRTRTDYYHNPNYNDFPVIYVSWSQAKQYCRWAGGRLPTEAEWEKAARGWRDKRLFPWGNNDGGGKLANNDAIQTDLVKVGSYPAGASPYGVMDMAGNVFEWITDWYGGNYYQRQESRDPQGPADGTERVIRGGSQDFRAAWGSVSFRDDSDPNEATDQVGFRCVIPAQE